MGYFHLLALRNNVSVNMGIQISPQVLLSILLVAYSEVELLDCVLILYFLLFGLFWPREMESTVL